MWRTILPSAASPLGLCLGFVRLGSAFSSNRERLASAALGLLLGVLDSGSRVLGPIVHRHTAPSGVRARRGGRSGGAREVGRRRCSPSPVEWKKICRSSASKRGQAVPVVRRALGRMAGQGERLRGARIDAVRCVRGDERRCPRPAAQEGGCSRTGGSPWLGWSGSVFGADLGAGEVEGPEHPTHG